MDQQLPKTDNKEKEKPPEESKRADVDFFDELPIRINMEEIEGAESFYIFMRPLLVEELQILNRVTFLQEKKADCEQASLLLISLMIDTLNVDGEEVPVEATAGLVANMIEYNFPPDMTDPDKKTKKKPTGKDGLIDCFDFLVAHGHNYSEILQYPVPVFNDFIIAIAERLGIKKKPVDAATAFRKLGIPINPRGNNE